jgi:hypothetical protein
MNNDTDIRRLFEMCAVVLSFDPEMPDKIAGQVLFAGRMGAPFFIGKTGS